MANHICISVVVEFHGAADTEDVVCGSSTGNVLNNHIVVFLKDNGGVVVIVVKGEVAGEGAAGEYERADGNDK